MYANQSALKVNNTGYLNHGCFGFGVKKIKRLVESNNLNYSPHIFQPSESASFSVFFFQTSAADTGSVGRLLLMIIPHLHFRI